MRLTLVGGAILRYNREENEGGERERATESKREGRR